MSSSSVSRPPESVVAQRAKWPVRFERKAMRLPSGNQSGMLSVFGSVVSCAGFLPSASTTQMSPDVPLRHSVSAILRPSGEKAGRLLRRLVFFVSWAGGPDASPVAFETATDQRLLVFERSE